MDYESSRVDDVVAALRAAGCVFAEDEARLLIGHARRAAELAELVARRVSGVPLEQILGRVVFCGLTLAIEPGVFVPRQRTAFLVHRAADLARPGAVVLDLCCGSGALGAALAALAGPVQLYAADVDPAAVRCARRNLDGIGEVVGGDLFDELPQRLRGHVDLLLVNAPYVPTAAIADMPPEARDYEPRVALDGGVDGLDVHRRVAAEAAAWLRPGGAMLIETSDAQVPDATTMLTRNGFAVRLAQDDDVGATALIASTASG